MENPTELRQIHVRRSQAQVSAAVSHDFIDEYHYSYLQHHVNALLNLKPLARL